MYQRFTQHVEDLRTLLGADRLCFWLLDEDGAAQPMACAPASWLRHPFQQPATAGDVERVHGALVRARLPLVARQGLPSDLGQALLVLAQRDGHSGFLAFWSDARQAPGDLDRLASMLSLNWSMVVQGQARLDRVTSAPLQLDSLVTALPQGVAVVAPAGKRSLINAPAARWLGLAPGPVDPAVLADALYRWVHRSQEQGNGAQALGILLREGTGQAGHFQLTFEAPHLIVEVTLAPIGPGEGWVWLMQDVTSQREAAERLQRALSDADQANAAKSAFLATMSHELRTPLNAVLGFSRLLEESLQEPQAQRQARYIRETGETLTTILNDVLDIAKIEAGKFQMDPRPFEMAQVFESCASIFRVVAADRGLDFDMVLPPGLPTLVGDPVRLRQIVQNLLSNAFKFTERGAVTLSLQVQGDTELPDGARGLQLQLQVRDSGIGMTSEQLQRVFERFEQAERSIATRFGGTGLGLAIVQALVQMMNGRLQVASTPGEGTAFTLELAFAYALTEAPGQQAFDAQWQEPPLRVLVADDVFLNRQVMRALLESRGHEVIEAEDGEQAVERVASACPDLVLMDLDMPRMDGLQATRRIRAQQGPGRHVPIHALTGKAFAEDVTHSLEAGMDGHLAKPFQHDELVRLLQETARRREAGAANGAGG